MVRVTFAIRAGGPAMKLKNLVAGLAVALAFAGAAFANPISYSTVNVPFDTPQAAAAAVITAVNSSSPAYAYTATCTGTTTATCVGTRFVVSVTGLTTAAG